VVAGANFCDIHLHMVGPGDVARARKRAQELGLSGRVRIEGRVDAARITRLLSSSHVLVLPSRAEGQPMAVLEAMAHGLCVVGTSVGGIPDLLAGECGLLVPVDDVAALAAALSGVVADPELRARLGGRAWARVRERYDLDLTWRALDGLYEELVR
jgi:glycosyltransferase involved in cell wall biosynthesis